MNYRNFALKQARLNIVHQQQLAKLRFDRNRSHPNFQLSDLVWMKPFGTRSKFDARYTGSAKNCSNSLTDVFHRQRSKFSTISSTFE